MKIEKWKSKFRGLFQKRLGELNNDTSDHNSQINQSELEDFIQSVLDDQKKGIELNFINKICPRHDRSSCSDDDIGNGYGSRASDIHGFARCTRCMLLDIKNGVVFSDEFKSEVDRDGVRALLG